MGISQSVDNHYVVQQKIEHTVDKMGHDGFIVKPPDAGHFGSVRRSVNRITQEVRAIKHIPKNTPNAKEKVLEEVELMKAVSGGHVNIVQFIEHFEDWDNFDLVFEFCGNGTIDDAIKGSGLDHSAAARFCHQWLSALVFLKQQRILHRDIKPANILLKDSRTSKLADFGSACFLDTDVSIFHRGGTPAFWPPEVDILPRGDGYSFPFDVWTVGITLYMILFDGVHPFMSQGHIDQKLLRVSSFDSGMMWVWNANLLQLLRWLLMPSPRQRLAPEIACNHAWLGSFGFGKGTFSENIPTKLLPDSYGRWG